MPVVQEFLKDPQAVLDYTMDWSEWLATGDVVSASTWEVDDDAVVIDSDAFTDTTTTVYLSLGTSGCTYRVTNKITTSEGRVDRRSFSVLVASR